MDTLFNFQNWAGETHPPLPPTPASCAPACFLSIEVDEYTDRLGSLEKKLVQDRDNSNIIPSGQFLI